MDHQGLDTELRTIRKPICVSQLCGGEAGFDRARSRCSHRHGDCCCHFVFFLLFTTTRRHRCRALRFPLQRTQISASGLVLSTEVAGGGRHFSQRRCCAEAIEPKGYKSNTVTFYKNGLLSPPHLLLGVWRRTEALFKKRSTCTYGFCNYKIMQRTLITGPGCASPNVKCKAELLQEFLLKTCRRKHWHWLRR